MNGEESYPVRLLLPVAQSRDNCHGAECVSGWVRVLVKCVGLRRVVYKRLTGGAGSDLAPPLFFDSAARTISMIVGPSLVHRDPE